MNYETLKNSFIDSVQSHYAAGMLVEDIRASIHAADLHAEKLGALELMEIVQSIGKASGGRAA